MEKFWALFKIIIEKYLIKTLISIVVVGGALLITPSECWIYSKMDKNFYMLFVFSIAFIICVCFEKIFKIGKEQNDEWKNKKVEINRELEIVWEFIDGISSDELNILKKLIENDNKPIMVFSNSFDYEFYFANTLFKSDILNWSYHKKENENYEKIYFGNFGPKDEEYLESVVCKLNDRTYKILKKGYKKFGKISNIV